MREELSSRTSVARKVYKCHATARILDIAFYDDFTQEEMDQVKKAVEEDGDILPGTTYLRVVYKDEGVIRTYRARPEMDAIAQRHDMWEVF